MSRRRLLAAIAAAGIAGGGALIALSSSGGEPPSAPARSTAGTASLYAGIPQRGFALGRADAPVTLVDYVDLQCPVCRVYDERVLPALVRDYVRSGRLRIELRAATILGPDSVIAHRALAAAARQNRAFDFAGAFYADQGTERSGYVTPGFLRSVGSASRLDVGLLLRTAGTDAAQALVERHAAEFAAQGFDGTPSFRLGRTGGPLTALTVSALEPDQFTGPIDALLAR